MIPRALTIAGSDSGGGAGIQADLKTFTVHCVYGTTAITALTAQNTLGVTAVHPIPAEIVVQQIDAVLGDIGSDAVKTGMLANADIVRAVAAALCRHQVRNLVIDPVMFAQSGARLLEDDAAQLVITELMPLATIVTPNVPEAEALTGSRIAGLEDVRSAAIELHRRGARACLVKGGHLNDGTATDIFYDGTELRELPSPRITTRHTHGTGCQLSAAIAANLARGLELPEAVAGAKRFITAAIADSIPLGGGDGPANPLTSRWRLGS